MWSSPKCTGETHAAVSTHWCTGKSHQHTHWWENTQIPQAYTSYHSKRRKVVKHFKVKRIMENHRDGPAHAIPIFPFYWNRDVNSFSKPHSLIKGQWWDRLREKTLTILHNTQIWQRNSTGMSNGLLGALKTTKKAANTHIESVLRGTWSVWREDAGHTHI